MNLRFKMILGCALCCAAVGCSDDSSSDKVPCTPETFITACTNDLTHVTICHEGYVSMNQCPFGCDAPTGTCKDAQGNVSVCTEASYPAKCIDESTRVFCNNGQKDTQTCPENTKCINNECIDASVPACTEATYPVKCLDDATRTYCSGGQIMTQPCPAGTKCVVDSCVAAVDNKCTAETYPDTCTDEYTRTYCNQNGFKSSEKCIGSKCINGKCVKPEDIPDPNKCDESYVDKCMNGQTLSSCVNGKVTITKCKAGTICNDASGKAQCRTPEFRDKCDPATFSEICVANDTQVATCDPETKKVIFIKCEKEYGDGYKCDIRENFSGPGMNAVMCYSKEDNCSAEGDIEESICYKDDETGFRKFYKETYTCTKFNTGFHKYFTKIEECPGNTKCGYTGSIRTECYDVSNAIPAPKEDY